MDKRCKNCHYNRKLSSSNIKDNFFCAYILITGQPRPCTGGKDCTAYKKKEKVKNRWIDT